VAVAVELVVQVVVVVVVVLVDDDDDLEQIAILFPSPHFSFAGKKSAISHRHFHGKQEKNTYHGHCTP
jgi:hypothetical protein